MKNIFLVFCGLLLTLNAHSRDLGFRYKNGTCVNSTGQTGLNPSFLGQCADLRQISISRFDLDETDFSGSNFESADLQGSTFRRANLTAVNFKNTNLSGVVFEGATLEKTNFSGASLINSHFAEAKFVDVDFSGADMTGLDLSYGKLMRTNFSNAKLTNSVFDYADLTEANFTNASAISSSFKEAQLSRATLDNGDFTRSNFLKAKLTGIKGVGTLFSFAIFRNADFSDASVVGAKFTASSLENANLSRAIFSESVLRSANLTGANVTQCQFKDALINKNTKLPFTAEEALKLGMILSKYSVLVLWDEDNADVDSLITYFNDNGVETTKSAKSAAFLMGNENLSDYSAVLHLSGAYSCYSRDIAESGQLALVNYVRSGGTYVATQWISFMVDSSRMLNKMRDLVLLTYNDGRIDEAKYTPVESLASHPLLNNVVGPQSIYGGRSIGVLRSFQESPSVAFLMTGTSTEGAFRLLGAGKIVNFGFTGSVMNSELTHHTLLQAPVRQLLLNAVTW